MSVSSPPAVTQKLPPQSSLQSRRSEHLSLLCYAHRRFAVSRENVEGGKKVFRALSSSYRRAVRSQPFAING